MKATFISTVRAMTEKATALTVPDEAVASLGTQKRPPVIVSLNGHSYRSTVSSMGHEFLLPFSADHREAAGVKAGDQVEVTIELDLTPRLIEVPADLAAALAEKAGARDAFDALAPSRRKDFVRKVEEAKTKETRDRRIADTVAKMGEA